MHVGSLRIYPVKSTRARVVESARVHRHGLDGDRRWAVVDETGQYLTASTHPRLLSVRARPAPDHLVLTAPGFEPLQVEEPSGGPRVGVTFSRLTHASDAGDPAAKWFGQLLDQDVRLVWQSDPARRTISPDRGGRPGEPLSLADAAPLLLTTAASFDRLARWLADAGSSITDLTDRMRPSVVVDDAPEPFAEDAWERIRIGDVTYRLADHCNRCVLTTVDPVGLGRGPEPIRTLSRHRKADGKVWFGTWIVPDEPGTIAVGDEVRVDPRRDAAPTDG